MKRLLLSILFFLCFLSVFAQQPPATEIYLLDLKVKKNSVSISSPRNITNHPGYDNQPFFHPDKSIIYYTSADETGNTDIVSFDFALNKTTQLTKTIEKEYSPTVTPDKQYLSCIIQREGGAQDLGKYPIEGGEPIILIDSLIVGYHVWVDEQFIIAFVLGEPTTLQLINLKNKESTRLANKPGRSLHQIPGTSLISFVDKSTDVWVIKKYMSVVTTITTTLPGREDLAWTPDKKIVMSDGKKLFFYNSVDNNGWQEITLPDGMPAGSITRLAINKKGDKLAFVVSE